MPQNVFVGRAAEFYDTSAAAEFDPAAIAATVDFLVEQSRGGPALELAIGTGRIGLPLSQRGVAVHGIEISDDMVAQLRAKPGADAIGITVGDMATARVDGTFSLAYLVYNTIENLLDQDEQVACFQNVARHLAAGGRFVIEVEVPQLQRLPPGEIARPFEVTERHLGFDTFDLATQRLTSHHYWISGDRVTTFQSHHRYVWPSELDLMARIAGLRLCERWADWDRSPFTSESRKH
ncbi:MAG: methyltransferase domain-containing protein, partial [Dehalococcoidia bacterium]